MRNLPGLICNQLLVCLLLFSGALVIGTACSDDDTGGDPGVDATSDTNDEDVNQSDISEPDSGLPDAEIPDADEPDVDLPDVNQPDADIPDVDLPDTEVPDTNEPDADDPDTVEPDVENPDVDEPDTVDPDAGEPRVCGGFSGQQCNDDEFCKFPDNATCDFADAIGHCMPRPTNCDGVDSSEYCGCDGVSYRGKCEANKAGTDVAAPGACGGPNPDECAAQDARGEGQCDMLLGIFWDGDACVPISGCSCVGDDCDDAYADEDECTADRLACFEDCRTQGCPSSSDTCQSCWTTWACVPAGAAC